MALGIGIALGEGRTKLSWLVSCPLFWLRTGSLQDRPLGEELLGVGPESPADKSHKRLRLCLASYKDYTGMRRMVYLGNTFASTSKMAMQCVLGKGVRIYRPLWNHEMLFLTFQLRTEKETGAQEERVLGPVVFFLSSLPTSFHPVLHAHMRTQAEATSRRPRAALGWEPAL